jgi:hypothetical protein
MDTIPEPVVHFLEQLAELRFTPEADARIQQLMDRNNDGELTPSEYQELASLASLSEQMSLVRGKALVLLGRQVL